MENMVYLCLGSNSGDSVDMLAKARASIAARIPGAKILLVSPLYYTEPQGYKDQPWFVNQVVKLALDPSWQPGVFLEELLALENSLGRKRGIRFGPRTIDIDLLLFGNIVSASEKCRIPHPAMHERAFVLLPLYVIEPTLKLRGKLLTEWLAKLSWSLQANRIYQQ